jgi:hypothetical protein
VKVPLPPLFRTHKDLKRLVKRFSSLEEDLGTFIKVAMNIFHKQKIDSGAIFHLSDLDHSGIWEVSSMFTFAEKPLDSEPARVIQCITMESARCE